MFVHYLRINDRAKARARARAKAKAKAKVSVYGKCVILFSKTNAINFPNEQCGWHLVGSAINSQLTAKIQRKNDVMKTMLFRWWTILP